MSDQGRNTARSSAATREALVEAAVHLFAHQGFADTGTRQIAGRAGANVAAIGYHFGGKERLRLACAEAIAERVGRVFASAMVAPATTPADALAQLEAVISAVVRFLALGHRADDMAAFVLRELTENGPAVDILYRNLIGPRHRELCALWAAATGHPQDSEDTRLSVFSMIGQVVYFRIGQPVILRRMDWSGVDEAAAARITAVLIRNLRAAVIAAREAVP